MFKSRLICVFGSIGFCLTLYIYKVGVDLGVKSVEKIFHYIPSWFLHLTRLNSHWRPSQLFLFFWFLVQVKMRRNGMAVFQPFLIFLFFAEISPFLISRFRKSNNATKLMHMLYSSLLYLMNLRYELELLMCWLCFQLSMSGQSEAMFHFMCRCYLFFFFSYSDRYRYFSVQISLFFISSEYHFHSYVRPSWFFISFS